MRHLFVTLIIAITAALSFTVTGCSNPVKEQLANPDMQGEKGIRVVSFQAQYQGSVLRVQAEVENTNKKNARVFYRFRWLDGQGHVVAAHDQWKPIIVYGKQSVFIIDAAPNPDVVDYRMEFNVEYPMH